MVSMLCALWPQGVTVEVLEEKIGVGRNAIRIMAGRLKLKRPVRTTKSPVPRPPRPESDWTTERIAELRQLWASGLSCREIGLKLGVTRSAVGGKARRLDLRWRGKQSTPPKHPTASIAGLTLDDWPKLGECLYPHGDVGDPDFHFCKKPVATNGAPYCFEHHKLCFVAAKPMRRGHDRPDTAANLRRDRRPAVMILSDGAE